MREQLLAAMANRPIVGPFEIEGIGKVWFREMSISEYAQMASLDSSGMPRMLPFLICDEQGKRPFSATDIAAFSDGKVSLVNDLFTLAIENGALPDMRAAKGN